jgi:hypothetical protein
LVLICGQAASCCFFGCWISLTTTAGYSNFGAAIFAGFGLQDRLQFPLCYSLGTVKPSAPIWTRTTKDAVNVSDNLTEHYPAFADWPPALVENLAVIHRRSG